MTEKIVIITGLSGSGKSSVARTLEDRGYFCVDNIPVDLIPKLVELIDSRGGKKFPLAVVLDLRQRQFFPRYSDILATMEDMGASVDIVFVDARDEVIVRRYSETRRQHPLVDDGNLRDGISRERIELRSIREKANRVIDTSDMTVHRLREEVEKIFGSSIDGKLKIVVTSFGFGRGVPIESDLVMDVRFLPNPYFVEELKMKDGRDPAVCEWIMSKTVTKEFLEKLDDLLIFLLPLYIREGKRYFTVAVGCTGGRHRSVAVVEHVAELLRRQGYSGLEVRHREMPT